jgi:type II secretory pathway pseudopilin PulG
MKRAFTLFELLLVLLLIVIMYGLFVQNFKINQNSAPKAVKLEKLGAFLDEQFGGTGQKISVRCTDNCLKCRLLLDNNDTNQTLQVFDGSSVDIYEWDGKRLEKKELDDYWSSEYKRDKSCFALDLYPNGSLDAPVIVYGGKVYSFGNYLEGGEVFDSISDAQDALESRQREARER